LAGRGAGGGVPPASSNACTSRDAERAFGLGIATNLLNPSVIVFYTTLVPQFISARDPFLPRFTVLAATHVAMALVWLTCYALVVGRFADRLSRPGVRQAGADAPMARPFRTIRRSMV
jgi:threonine/homoserine/homoserine lactone efflux protein